MIEDPTEVRTYTRQQIKELSDQLPENGHSRKYLLYLDDLFFKAEMADLDPRLTVGDLIDHGDALQYERPTTTGSVTENARGIYHSWLQAYGKDAAQ